MNISWYEYLLKTRWQTLWNKTGLKYLPEAFEVDYFLLWRIGQRWWNSIPHNQILTVDYVWILVFRCNGFIIFVFSFYGTTFFNIEARNSHHLWSTVIVILKQLLSLFIFYGCFGSYSTSNMIRCGSIHFYIRICYYSLISGLGWWYNNCSGVQGWMRSPWLNGMISMLSLKLSNLMNTERDTNADQHNYSREHSRKRFSIEEKGKKI